MQNVLLLINEEAHIRELARVVDALQRAPGLRPVVFMEDRLKHLGTPSEFASRKVEVLWSDLLTLSEYRGPLSLNDNRLSRLIAATVADVVPSLLSYLPARINRWINWGQIINGDQVRGMRRALLHRAAVSEAVLSERCYASIVMCEDNVELDTAVWVAVSRRHGTRSIIVPYTISNTAEFAESYVDHEPYQVRHDLPNRVTARLFPAWVLNYKNRQFLRTIPSKILAMEQLGLRPPNPWLLNSSYVDVIAVESAAMHDYYRLAGIPEEQLVLTGSLADDVIASTLGTKQRERRALLASLGLTDDRPLVLCGFPPDQNTFDRSGCEYGDYDDLINFWGDCLSAISNCNVLIRAHPKTRSDRLEAFRRRGLTIADVDTARLIPLCDLYVASVSATIRWAIACGVPAINYDVYQYGYKDYDRLRGVVPVSTRKHFRKLLTELTENPVARAALAEAQQQDAARWGVLDGNSTQRMVALLGLEARAADFG